MSLIDNARASAEAVYTALTEAESQKAALTQTNVELVQERTALTGQLASVTVAFDNKVTELKVANLTIKERDALVESLRARIRELEANIPTPIPTISYLPRSVATLQAYLDLGYGPKEYRKADDKLPNGAPVYVFWPTNAPADWDLESQFRTMQQGQVLVLPERDLIYPIDSTDGFAAAGVEYITDTSLPVGQQRIPIKKTWRGKTARTWFAMARMHGGILGLGPKAVVQPTESAFTRPAQGTDKTMTYTNSAGVSFKITGNQEKLIDISGKETAPYIGNFTLRGRSFGGVAYHGPVANNMTVENMDFDSCWRGHGYAPNSETGAFAAGGTSKVRNITINGKDAGVTSIIMTNNVDNGLLENVMIVNCRGGITRWSCSGTDVWRNVNIPGNCNVNIEANDPGYALDWEGGTIGGTNFSLNVRSPYDSAKIKLKDVKLVGLAQTLIANVWAATSDTTRKQKASDITYFDKAGTALPVKVVGALATS